MILSINAAKLNHVFSKARSHFKKINIGAALFNALQTKRVRQ